MAKFPEPVAASQSGDVDDALVALAARASAQMGGENFPVALRALPRGARSDLGRAYAYARFVDDVGDQLVDKRRDGARGAGADRTAILAQLDAVERDLNALVAGGTARLAPVAALAPLLDRVPAAPFRDLVQANRLDQSIAAYETFADLLGYCTLSAAPVGRIVLHLAGAATDGNLAASDDVCAGLQVLEHCQDVGEDARAGRVYLPAVDLRVAGIDPAALRARSTPSGLPSVLATQVARSRDLLRPGRALVRRLHGWARVAVAGYVGGGLATAAALDAGGYDVLGRDLRPSKVATAGHAIGLLVPRRT